MPEENRTEEFADLEGLPEGLEKKLEEITSRKVQSALDRERASRAKAEQQTQQKPAESRQSSGGEDLLETIGRYVADGLSFGEARDKAELEEMKRFFRETKTGQKAERKEAQTQAGIDVSQLGFDANDVDVQSIIASDKSEIEKALALGELKALRNAGHKKMNLEENASGGGDEAEEHQAKIQSYIKELQAASELPSGSRRLAMTAVKKKWRNLGVDVDHINFKY